MAQLMRNDQEPLLRRYQKRYHYVAGLDLVGRIHNTTHTRDRSTAGKLLADWREAPATVLAIGWRRARLEVEDVVVAD